MCQAKGTPINNIPHEDAKKKFMHMMRSEVHAATAT
jgi:hypothetical protein